MRSAPVRALLLVVLASALLGAASAAAADASSAIRPAPGAPDPRKMVLTPADLGGAKVTSQGYYKDDSFPSVISYARELENGRAGSVALPYVDSEAEVGKSATASAITLSGARKYLGTKQARKELEEEFLEEFPLGTILGSVQVGKPRKLGVGQDSFDVTVVVRFLDERTEYHLAAFRVDRVLGILGVVGRPGKRVPLATMTKLGKIMAARMTAELVPRSISLPTISGSPTVGQTLTATNGTWSGKPTSFAYQWQRCDAAGGSCADIGGASGQSYVVSDPDLGATMRVRVTAANSAGSASAASTPTGAVQPASAPVSTSPPTISGAAQVGQTLTASTGNWSGSPTGFGFQWQRCNASGVGCADVPGATGGTYAITPADAGSTIRVVVTATNGFGSASAASAPTSPVP